MKDISELKRDVLDLDKFIKFELNESAKRFAVQQISFLAIHNPVDTGKAISNWFASVGFPKTKEIEAHSKGEKGSTREENVAQTIAAAKKAVANKKLGQSIYITNNVQYMDALNKGHSPQANPGWIAAVSDINEDNWKMKLPVRLGYKA